MIYGLHCYAEALLSGVWMLMSICSLVVCFTPLFRVIAQHGKITHIGTQSSSRKDFVAFFGSLSVPKNYFRHFYLVGFSISLLCMSFLSVYSQVYPYSHMRFCWVRLLLFSIHVVRRLYECIYITYYGESTMHVGGYIAGLVHYILVPVSCVVSTPVALTTAQYTELRTATPISMVNSPDILACIWFVAAVVIFILANYSQFQFHALLHRMKQKRHKLMKEDGAAVILSVHTEQRRASKHTGVWYKGIKRDSASASTTAVAPVSATAIPSTSSIRSSGSSSSTSYDATANYALPFGWGFDYVCCPHYTAEICVYFSLWLVDPSVRWIAILPVATKASNTTTAAGGGMMTAQLPYHVMLCLFLWVASNLSMVAHQHMQWYRDQYPSAFTTGTTRSSQPQRSSRRHARNNAQNANLTDTSTSEEQINLRESVEEGCKQDWKMLIPGVW